MVTVPGGSTSFVGRERELEVITQGLHRAAAGVGQVVVVEGEPGIGKTRLVQQAADLARSRGFEVAAGACESAEHARPFAALARALGISEAAADDQRSRVARLLDRDDAPAHGTGTPPGVQFRIVEALGDTVERLASQQPVLLALEDLHWADPSTLVAMRSIARRVPTLPVAIITTVRSGHEVPGLHALIDDLIRAGANQVVLGPLDGGAVTALVTEMLGASPGSALLERVGDAAGNPLFVTEYVRAVLDATTAGDTAEPGIPEDFRRAVLRRVGALDDTTAHVLRLASLLGASFSPSDLAAVLGRPLLELEGALQQAFTNGLVADEGTQLAFRHGLVRDAIYEHMPLAVRRQLHREVGRALASAGASPVAVAHHFGVSADPGDLEAVGALRDAARFVAARAPTVAVDLLERARDLLGALSRDQDELLAELVIARAWAGKLADAEVLASEVLARGPTADVAGRVRCGLVYALMWQGRPHEARRHAIPAAGESLSADDAALLQAEAALATLLAFDLRTARELAAAAAASAEAVGHDLALCTALTAGGWAAIFAGEPNEAIELVRRAMAVADRSPDDQPYLAHPRFFPGMPLVFQDRLEEAEAVLQAGRRRAEEMGLAWSLPLYHAHLGIRRFVAGDWDDAVAEFEAGLAVAEEVGLHLPINAATASWLCAIQVYRGDLEGAESTIGRAFERIAETGPQLGMGLLNWARAVVLAARGEVGEAIALLQGAWAMYTAGGPVTDPWTAMELVRLLTQSGRHEEARSLLPAIDDQAAASGTPFARGHALRCRGLVEQDPSTLVKAVEEYRHCPRVFERAGACEDAAELLAAAGNVSDGVALYDEALEIYDGLAAAREAARVRAQLRAHGVAKGTRTSRARATVGWESLTPTEVKVASLVAQRLSNPEVAERLFVSRHTIESHLKHIYRKLGISSRLELATIAARKTDAR